MEKSGKTESAAQHRHRHRKRAAPKKTQFWASSLTSPSPSALPCWWDVADPGYDEFVANVFQEWSRIHAVAATVAADGAAS
ncbi:hypothetical protein [Medusavirus stheno T3]|uniref:Uncharacterized protein n=1 Tax=Medusavirus stheno T3 TaxID=3069717 RepID=A0A7S7YG34_9VIRU|nr:hypothetical protein QKU73_gp260 [Acanthamoeba castellanii medusavirus]QPB44515.1 hypothetical protein [Medusavirus stheno T3]